MEKFRSETEKSRSGIQDKHPGSAALDTKSYRYEKTKFKNQSYESGSEFIAYWASRIRMRYYLHGSGSYSFL
jgi:hypothetical protein